MFDLTELGRLLLARLTPQELRQTWGGRGARAGGSRLGDGCARTDRSPDGQLLALRRDHANTPSPPRLWWQDYLRRGAASRAHLGGWQAWGKKLVAATENASQRALEVIAARGPTAITVALRPPWLATSFTRRTATHHTSGSPSTNATTQMEPPPVCPGGI